MDTTYYIVPIALTALFVFINRGILDKLEQRVKNLETKVTSLESRLQR